MWKMFEVLNVRSCVWKMRKKLSNTEASKTKTVKTREQSDDLRTEKLRVETEIRMSDVERLSNIYRSNEPRPCFEIPRSPIWPTEQPRISDVAILWTRDQTQTTIVVYPIKGSKRGIEGILRFSFRIVTVGPKSWTREGRGSSLAGFWRRGVLEGDA